MAEMVRTAVTARLRLLAALVLLAGGWLAASPRTALAATPGDLLYALVAVDGGFNQIYGFRADPVTGGLTALPGFPLATGGTGTSITVGEQMAYDAANRRLYALNDGSNTVSGFSVNLTSGALTPLPWSPLALAADGWNCIDVHPSGSPLVMGGTSQVASFQVSPTSATAAAGSPFSTGAAYPFSCTFSQNGAYVYFGGNLGSLVAGFSVNAASGVLTPLAGSPFDAGAGFPAAYATDGAGRLFSANIFAGQARVFTTASGIPAPVSGNPFASGLGGAVFGLLHPNGYYMVADRAGATGKVGVFRIAGSGAATTLAAVAGSPFDAGGAETHVLALGRGGAYLYAANAASRNITTFSVSATGALSSPVVQPANTLGAAGRISGMALAEQPQETGATSGFVYALQEVGGGPNQIYGYRVDGSSGALTPLAGFPVLAGGNGQAAATAGLLFYDQARQRLYVVNDGNDTLTAFGVNAATGALSALPFSPIPLGSGLWLCVTVHPSGSPVVAADGSGNKVASFNVTATTATPAAGSPFSAGVPPYGCGFSWDGASFYTGGNAGTAFAGFGVNAGTGVLTPLPGSPYNSGAGGPAGFTADSAGRLFITNINASQVQAYTTSGGVPTGVTGNPFPSGLGGAVFAQLHPAGYYLAAGRSTGQVGVFRIAGAGAATTLTAAAGSPFTSGGSGTNGLAVDDGGGFVFAANATSRNLSTFAMDPATGALSGVGLQPIDTIGSTGRVGGVVFVRKAANYLPQVHR